MPGPSRLFDRPFLDQQFALLPLFVSGVLEDFNPAVAYESRLAINNAMGRCSVQLVDGTLPAGGGVSVDNDTSEVVVAWPATTTADVSIQNAGLETGDLTGFTYTTIGGVAALAVTNEHSDSGDYSAHWPGGVGTGGEGGIEFVAVSDSAADVRAGMLLSGSARVMYNPNGHVFGSQAQARIHWYDSGGNFISDSKGTRIFGRQHNRKWTTSPVSGRAPAGAVTARMAVWGRARAGDVYFDTLTWDAQADIGPVEDAYAIELLVRDSGGRAAGWSGTINRVAWTPALLTTDAKSLWMDATAEAGTLDADDGVYFNRWTDSFNDFIFSNPDGTTADIGAPEGSINGLRAVFMTDAESDPVFDSTDARSVFTGVPYGYIIAVWRKDPADVGDADRRIAYWSVEEPGNGINERFGLRGNAGATEPNGSRAVARQDYLSAPAVASAGVERGAEVVIAMAEADWVTGVVRVYEYVDGVEHMDETAIPDFAGTSDAVVSRKCHIGTDDLGTTQSNCHIGEIVAQGLSAPLSEADRLRLFGYLAWRWRGDVTDHDPVSDLPADFPYKASPP